MRKAVGGQASICVIKACDGDIDSNAMLPYLRKSSDEHKPLIVGTLAQHRERLDPMLGDNYLYLPLDDDFFRDGVGSRFEEYRRNSPWESRSPTAFWRGGCSGGGIESPRVRTVAKLFDHPGANARLRDHWHLGKNIPPQYFGDAADISEFFRHKIFLIIDGNSISSNRMWGFATGCVPLLVTDAVCWFTEYLKPFENCVIVEDFAGLSDLAEKIEWLQKNDGKARQIAENALRFAEEVFAPKFQRDHLNRKIDEILSRVGRGQGA